MLRTQSPLMGYLLPIALGTLFLYPSQASAQRASTQKVNATIVDAPLTLSLTADSSVVSACSEGAGPQVGLSARTVSPAGNPIRYRWSTSAGRITGDGPTVNWDLSGLAPGSYKAFVDIETGGTDATCQAFSSTSVLVNACPPPRPVCPNISITCPTTLGVDQPITFSSNVAGGTPNVTPIYNWTVSAGTIIEGQGTSQIKVDTTGLAGETVRASLSIDGYTLDCADSCSIQLPVPRIQPRKFDEFPAISRNDEKARLDNFAVELQADPSSTGYVIVYPGRSSKSGDSQKHTSRVIDYLVNSRGIDARRIITLTGNPKDELMVELWISPQGATPPTP